MNELIHVGERDNKKIVSAKELYNFLGYKSNHWARWYRKNITNNDFAIEGTDYIYLTLRESNSETQDFGLSIDFAKKLSMLARTQKGEQARNYFIACEEKLKEVSKYQLPQTHADALRALATEIEEKAKLQIENNLMLPKAQFYDQVTSSKDAIDLGTAAKVLNMGLGRTKLFDFLRKQGVLMSNNQPYQKYIDCGYFRTIEQKFTKDDGTNCINIKTVVYQKGLAGIRRLILKVKDNPNYNLQKDVK